MVKQIEKPVEITIVTRSKSFIVKNLFKYFLNLGGWWYETITITV